MGRIVWLRPHPKWRALALALTRPAHELLWHAYNNTTLDDVAIANAPALCPYRCPDDRLHEWTYDSTTILYKDACGECAVVGRLSNAQPKVPIEAIDKEARLLQRDMDHYADRNPDARVDYRAVAAVVLDPDRQVPGWTAPRVLPPLWHETLDPRGPDGTTKYKCSAHKLTAILSCSVQNDGRAWLHLSVSHEKRIPSWPELVLAKEALIGDREAYKVIPPRERYVNINERVLHMFALLDEKATALPDFTHGTGGL